MATKKEILERLLDAYRITPVIVDIGSAGGEQPIFQPIASRSQIIGFDPDARGQDVEFGKNFKSRLLIPKAVTAEEHADTVRFTLTKYSSCSSTLQPDRKSTGSFLFRDHFDAVGNVEVPATTLDKVSRDHDIKNFDWIKVDSQGTDLRILRGLSRRLLDSLIAVDVEPGLIPFYVGEDTFSATHDFLINSEFWMSDLQQQNYAYVKPETAQWIAELLGRGDISELLEKSPTCIEGRYMRTVEHLKKGSVRFRQLAFVFALLDDKLGFAFEILKEFDSEFKGSALLKLSVDSACSLIKAHPDQAGLRTKVKRMIGR